MKHISHNVKKKLNTSRNLLKKVKQFSHLIEKKTQFSHLFKKFEKVVLQLLENQKKQNILFIV